MSTRRQVLAAALAAAPGAVTWRAEAQTASGQPVVPPAGNLFVVEFRIGPRWDVEKKAHEQTHFHDHSANLKRLRDAGSLTLGARYSDKGFVVLRADSDASARALIDADPAVQNQVFVYDLHAFHVFYGGCIEPPRRPG